VRSFSSCSFSLRFISLRSIGASSS
jgi:hypothetical protein